MNIPTADLALLVSLCSLIVSATVAYLTLIRKGQIKITQPTTIYFGADYGSNDKDFISPKVFLRALLYSTSKRGTVLSTLHIRLSRGESAQTFNIWVYGEDKLMRGSGLFVGENGVVFNHHFLLPADGTNFKFLPGRYKVELFATQVHQSVPRMLWSVNLEVSETLAEQMNSGARAGIYFDWQPNLCEYHAHLRP